MIPLSIDEIAALAPGELRRGSGTQVSGVTIDSRKVEAGDLFVAVLDTRRSAVRVRPCLPTFAHACSGA